MFIYISIINYKIFNIFRFPFHSLSIEKQTNPATLLSHSASCLTCIILTK